VRAAAARKRQGERLVNVSTTRLPTGGPRAKLGGVEAGRGVAATLVVLYHAALHVERNVGGTVLWGLPHFGQSGVDFFFVLSGFIISFVHRGDLGQPARLGKYAQRRFTRVLPFYWLVLGYCLLVLWVFHRQRFPGAWELVSNVLLLPQSKDQIVGGAWTLVYELLFYTLFATAICSRRLGTALFAAWAVLIVARFTLPSLPMNAVLLSALSSAFCLEFFLGIGCAYLLSRHRIPYTGVLLVMGIVAFGAAGACEVGGALYGFGSLARVVYGSCSVLIILALVERERSGLLRLPRLMASIGQASYSVYLVHLIAIGLTFKTVVTFIHPAAAWSAALWLVLCVVGVCGGVVASVWLEQPVIRLCRRHWPNERAAPAVGNQRAPPAGAGGEKGAAAAKAVRRQNGTEKWGTRFP